MSLDLKVGLSTVCRHLKEMDLKYQSCRCVPHKLTKGNKQARIRICNELIEKYQRNNFLRQLITADETWIYWDCEGTFHQTKCWAGGDIVPPKNVKRILSPRKT